MPYVFPPLHMGVSVHLPCHVVSLTMEVLENRSEKLQQTPTRVFGEYDMESFVSTDTCGLDIRIPS